MSLWETVRQCAAELLMRWAARLAPHGTPDGRRLLRLIDTWARGELRHLAAVETAAWRAGEALDRFAVRLAYPNGLCGHCGANVTACFSGEEEPSCDLCCRHRPEDRCRPFQEPDA